MAAAVGMELSWLYAWCIFIMTSGFHRPFPFPDALGTFLLAAACTRFSVGRGWRIVQVLGIHLLGFCLAGMRVVYAVAYPSYPFLRRDWVLAFFEGPKNPVEWAIIVLTLFWVLLFWIGGVTLARRSGAYLTLCSRFDLGVAAFLALLLLKLLLVVKGGIAMQDTLTEGLLFPFFVFSLLAIGLARNQGQGQKAFLSGYRGTGVLLTFTSAVLLFGTGFLLLLMPYLSLAAGAGYDALKNAAEPLGPVLAGILRFLFFGRQLRHDPPPPSAPKNVPSPTTSFEGTWWGELLERTLAWGLSGLAALLFFLACLLAAWYLLRWLVSRAPTEGTEQGYWDRLLCWVRGLWGTLTAIQCRIGLCREAVKRAPQFYGALLRWGRRSGFPPKGSETPMEYGLRLTGLFPLLGRDIMAIVEVYHRGVYAERLLSREHMELAGSALKKLHSPLLWPLRFKLWFLSSGGPE